jgi:hypothetical protein
LAVEAVIEDDRDSKGKAANRWGSLRRCTDFQQAEEEERHQELFVNDARKWQREFQNKFIEDLHRMEQAIDEKIWEYKKWGNLRNTEMTVEGLAGNCIGGQLKYLLVLGKARQVLGKTISDDRS